MFFNRSKHKQDTFRLLVSALKEVILGACFRQVGEEVLSAEVPFKLRLTDRTGQPCNQPAAGRKGRAMEVRECQHPYGHGGRRTWAGPGRGRALWGPVTHGKELVLL